MAGVKGRSGGNNAKSIAQHRIDGTLHATRHRFENPEAPVGRPEPPGALEGVAKDAWDRAVEALELCGILSRADAGALYQYAMLWAEVEALAVARAETSASVKILEENLHGLESAELVMCFQEITKLRRLEMSYTSAVRQGRNVLRAFLIEFGLTPSSRGRVKIVQRDEDRQRARAESTLGKLQQKMRALRAV